MCIPKEWLIFSIHMEIFRRFYNLLYSGDKNMYNDRQAGNECTSPAITHDPHRSGIFELVIA